MNMKTIQRSEDIEFLRLVIDLLANGFIYEYRDVPNIIGKVLKDQKESGEYILLSQNDFRVTFSCETDEQEEYYTMSYKLYQKDKELVKTEVVNNWREIRVPELDDLTEAGYPDKDPYHQFVAEIAVRYIPGLLLCLKKKDRLYESWSLLLSGMTKVSDKINAFLKKEVVRQSKAFFNKKFQEINNTQIKSVNIALGNGFKVAAQIDMADWDSMNAEGVVKLTYALSTSDGNTVYGVGSTDTFLCYLEGDDDISESSDMAYFDMLGHVIFANINHIRMIS